MKIGRRKILAGIAASTSALRAQEPAHMDPSIYIPESHRVDDREFLFDFMEEYPFADLVTASPDVRVTHLPVILDRAAGARGRIFGHVSRQNPQSQFFDGRHMGVAVFHGPDGYISPEWYEARDGVPTWNFAVVHARGTLHEISDKAVLGQMLDTMVRRFEAREGTRYSLSRISAERVSSLMKGLVGVEMHIDSLEGKFKLGQERSEADRQRLLEHLRGHAAHGRSLYTLSNDFYRTKRD